jgi:flagella basal body P-ring formation protein FlgA
MMMKLRPFLLGLALLATSATSASAQSGDDKMALPVLRADITVASDVVRVGDLVDNAGIESEVAVYRSPDLGTVGTLQVAQVLAALSAHKVIGVDTKGIKEVTVSRLARTLTAKDIKLELARAIEHHGGLGDAANLSLSFDRDLQDVRLEANYTGQLQPASVRYEPRSTRFDVTFAISNDSGATTQLRFTGNAIETVEAAVLTRDVERTDVLKSSDVMVERRPRIEIGSDAAVRDSVVGMQMRRPMRAGQALRVADLVKPDLVQRDQNVTVIFQTAGIYLTTRGKALDNGTEGDVVNVLNPQSKRTLSGVVTGRGQVTIQVATPTPVMISDTSATAVEPVSPAALANNSHVPASPVPSKPE